MITRPPRRFLCICSGISAPTSALKRHGFEPLAYAEIDPAAAAILAERRGAGRPMFMPDPDEPGIDPAEARSRANAIKALARIEWGDRVPNYGDFTRLRDDPMIVDADLTVGGTPCQDFSLAGLRASLGGDRGNLTMEFIRLANAVDDLRRDVGRPPAFHLWENVPGVLSTDDNAFGTFLGGMVGSDRPILPPKGRGWSRSGVVSGPRRVAAWRELDTQHFGLPQRRRRVFVLARSNPRGWTAADALLPIIDSLCGHSPPREMSGEGATADLARSLGGSGDREVGSGSGCEDAIAGGPGGASGGVDGKGRRRARRSREPGEYIPDITGTICADTHPGAYTGQDVYQDRIIASAIPLLEIGKRTGTSTTDPRAGIGIGAEGDVMFTLQASAQHGVAVSFSSNEPEEKVEAWGLAREILDRIDPDKGLTKKEMRGLGVLKDQAQTLKARGPGAVAIAFTSKDYGQDAGELAPTLRAMNHDKSHANAGGQIAVAFSMRGRDGENMAEAEADDVSPTIRTGGGDSSKPFVAQIGPDLRAFNLSPGSGSTGAPSAVETDVSHALTATGEADRNGRGTHVLQDAASFTVSNQSNGFAWEGEKASTVLARAESPGSSQFSGVRVGVMVRRLTPLECERLQGFDDHFTLTAFGSANRTPEDLEETFQYLLSHGFEENEARALADVPDGHRYRVLGNSMGVDVIDHIGAAVVRELDKEEGLA